MSLGAYVLRRVVRGIFTLWLVVTIVFVALRLSGDPATMMLSENASAEDIERLRDQLGLNQPLPIQYWTFLSKVVLQADLGQSIARRQPAASVVIERLGATLELAAAGFAIALLIGLPAGLLAAVRRGTIIDQVAMVGALLGQVMPSFFLGTVLVLICGLWLRILPTSGNATLWHLILPAITVAAVGGASIARLSRSALLDVVRQDYMRTAYAKGLRERTAILRHALRNAAIPVVTVLGIQLGHMLSGAVATEVVFAWPGVGRLAVTSIFLRDYPVVQAVVLMVAGLYVVLNLAVDILYGWLDPKIRYQ
ncbi:MAG: ABC transporter permease [Chloroflexi bacterium]|nr:ABC transporter permease [Chloroflexota bacterium]